MTTAVLPYNRSLDGLRAFAVTLVLLAHFPAIENIGASFLVKAAASGLRVGYLGVDIFFVLSGFLITRILLHEKDAGVLSFARFYMKRSLRIFPIFYLSLFFCLFAFELSAGEFFANALYVSNYYYTFDADPGPLRHTWSLSVEEQFYLFWPLLLVFCPRQKIGRLILVGVALVLVVAFTLSALLLDQEPFSRFVLRALPFRMLSLGAGAYIAFNPAAVASIKARYLVYPILLCPILIVSLYGYDGVAVPVVRLFAMTTWSVCIFVLVLNASDDKGSIIRRLFESAPLVYVGRISYGIYLYHYIVLFGMGILASHASTGVVWQTFATALAATFLIASLSFHFIERPFLKIKNRLTSNGV